MRQMKRRRKVERKRMEMKMKMLRQLQAHGQLKMTKNQRASEDDYQTAKKKKKKEMLDLKGQCDLANPSLLILESPLIGEANPTASLQGSVLPPVDQSEFVTGRKNKTKQNKTKQNKTSKDLMLSSELSQHQIYTWSTCMQSKPLYTKIKINAPKKHFKRKYCILQFTFYTFVSIVQWQPLFLKQGFFV